MCRSPLGGGPQKMSAQTWGTQHARNLVLSILTFMVLSWYFQHVPEQRFLVAGRCRTCIPSQPLPGLSSCICIL